MQIDAQVIALLSFIALLGLVYCLFGSGFFRMIFTFTMFVAGVFFAYYIAGIYFTTFIAKAAISLTGGLILALIFNIFHMAGKFLAGFIACGMAAVLILNLFHISRFLYFWDIVLLVGLFAGIAAAIKKTVLRIVTAFMGAFMVCTVVFYIIGKGINYQDFATLRTVFKSVSVITESYPLYFLVSVVLLACMGWLMQFWHGLRAVPKSLATYKPDLPQLTGKAEKTEEKAETLAKDMAEHETQVDPAGKSISA